MPIVRIYKKTIEKCPYCKNIFECRSFEQVPGFRMASEKECPYCKHTISRSLEYEFYTQKNEQEERVK